MNTGAAGLIVAFAIAAAGGFAAVKLGPVLGWVDEPDDPDLKAHRLPAVPLGGVAVFLAVHVGMLVTSRLDPYLLAGTALVLVLGLVDDRRGVTPLIRLGVEAVAGLILGLSAMGESWVRLLLIGILVVVAVNSVNLLDGLDGLAGLSGLVSALGLAGLALARGSGPVFGLILAGALAAFLLWNWHPARLFLGDNGAYVLALFLVYGMVQASESLGEVLVAVALFGVFFFDMAATLLRRALSHQPLFSRDRLHLYDRLVDRGMVVPIVALTAGTVQATYAALAIAADRALSTPGAVLFLLGIGAVIVVGLVKILGATRPGQWRPQ